MLPINVDIHFGGTSHDWVEWWIGFAMRRKWTRINSLLCRDASRSVCSSNCHSVIYMETTFWLKEQKDRFIFISIHFNGYFNGKQ